MNDNVRIPLHAAVSRKTFAAIVAARKTVVDVKDRNVEYVPRVVSAKVDVGGYDGLLHLYGVQIDGVTYWCRAVHAWPADETEPAEAPPLSILERVLSDYDDYDP